MNLPESAQEPLAHGVPKKAIQRRHQVLEACLSRLTEAEVEETTVLTGEDHEDPPCNELRHRLERWATSLTMS